MLETISKLQEVLREATGVEYQLMFNSKTGTYTFVIRESEEGANK